MDSGSVVSSISLTHSFDFTGRSAGSSSGRGRAMVQHHTTGVRPGRHNGSATNSNINNNNDLDGDNDNLHGTVPHHQHQYHHQHPQQPHRRRNSLDIYQHSETASIGGATDLSADRPPTHDTSRSFHLMRDASALSAQPDKSNFREKLRHWTVLEDASSPYLAPRPTTSLASQKPTTQLLMSDVEREMSFLLSRPSTSNFPAKPKELIEPLEGLLPSESPVTQKKFLVLPSIGHGLALRRQRSNLETINQLDYSRHGMETDADFFANNHNASPTSQNKNKSLFHNSGQHHHTKPKYNRHVNSKNKSHGHNRASSPSQRPVHHTGLHKSSTRSGGITFHMYPANPRESPTKAADTPMPLPPIPNQHHRGRREASLNRLHSHHDHVTQLDQWEEDDNSSSASCCSHDNRLEENIYDTDLDEVEEEEEEDLDRFRQRTPETYRSGTPPQPEPITPPPQFR
ncbi:hypothetical protein PoB_004641600 [Plakobranchus ocellatus]|uniref:Uncharacterized protein n=1 Tax=Plakobranchus ocellatus TaxID=259542 RepID=A0AAV4BHI9_9GAST|nr:hypothetical protein PoB_004641600 [Plakobranchus ocellatus]